MASHDSFLRRQGLGSLLSSHCSHPPTIVFCKNAIQKIAVPLKFIDSNIFPLNLTNYQQAKFRKTKAGVKLHLHLVFMEKGTSYPEQPKIVQKRISLTESHRFKRK